MAREAELAVVTMPAEPVDLTERMVLRPIPQSATPEDPGNPQPPVLLGILLIRSTPAGEAVERTVGVAMALLAVPAAAVLEEVGRALQNLEPPVRPIQEAEAAVARTIPARLL